VILITVVGEKDLGLVFALVRLLRLQANILEGQRQVSFHEHKIRQPKDACLYKINHFP
jgi:hypothetical protein